jgi:hypothetical protein
MRRACFSWCVFVASLAAIVPHAGAAPLLYDRELVRNGAAEVDAGSPDPKAAQPVIGWTTVPGYAPVLALRYGAPGGFPRVDSPGVSYHGRNFFWGGFSARAGAYQDIDVAGTGADIDARTVHCKLSAWLGGRGSLADHSTVSVTFLDHEGMNLGVAYIGPVTNQDRSNVTSFLYREVSRFVPAGTRTARITIVMVRFEGRSNDGYVDNVSFVLHKGTAPAH